MLLPANRGNWELGLGIAGRCHRGGLIQLDGRGVVVRGASVDFFGGPRSTEACIVYFLYLKESTLCFNLNLTPDLRNVYSQRCC